MDFVLSGETIDPGSADPSTSAVEIETLTDAGLSSVHVCRTLRRLKRHGIVETEEQMDVLIRDMEALAIAAKADPEELRKQIIPWG